MFVPHAHAQTQAQALQDVSTRCRAQPCLRPKARLAKRFTSRIEASGHPAVTPAFAHWKMTKLRPRAAAQPNYHKRSDAINISEWLAHRLAQKGSWICAACSSRRSLPEAADARAGASSAGVRGVGNRINASRCPWRVLRRPTRRACRRRCRPRQRHHPLAQCRPRQGHHPLMGRRGLS